MKGVKPFKALTFFFLFWSNYSYSPKGIIFRVSKYIKWKVFSGHIQQSFNFIKIYIFSATAAAAKSLQSCLTLCDPIDGSPPGSPVSGILQARTLEWVAISFSNAWKWKVKVKSLSPILSYHLPNPMGTFWWSELQAKILGSSVSQGWLQCSPDSSPWIIIMDSLQFSLEFAYFWDIIT